MSGGRHVARRLLIHADAFRGDVLESGAEGARTPDLVAASDALFQLSYSPGTGKVYRQYR